MLLTGRYETTFAREEEMDQEGISKEDDLDLAEQALSGHQAQAKWLDHCMNKLVDIFMLSGKTVEGTLKDFDAETLVLERPTGDESDTILVFKSAIQSIEPHLSGPGVTVFSI